MQFGSIICGKSIVNVQGFHSLICTEFCRVALVGWNTRTVNPKMLNTDLLLIVHSDLLSDGCQNEQCGNLKKHSTMAVRPRDDSYQ